jgi:hypothetical protein
MNVNEIGAVCFGVVVGYLTYRTLVRTGTKSSLDDLPAVLAVIGGGVITGLFPARSELFGWYAIGLLAGMVLFFLVYLVLNGAKKTGEVMLAPTVGTLGSPSGPGGGPRA